MQTAISINSCYRRAAWHATRWIYNVCEGQDGDRQEKEADQRIRIQVLDQVDQTIANYNHIAIYDTDMPSEGMGSRESSRSFQWVQHEKYPSLLASTGSLNAYNYYVPDK